MPYLAAHGTMKPPLGARVNAAHPFAARLLLAVPFAEGCGSTPAILSGPWSLDVSQPTLQLTPTNPTPTWVSNREGLAGYCSEYTRGWDIDRGLLNGAWLPYTSATICLIRRKVDTTLRTGVAFGESYGSGTPRMQAYVPYQDGTVYWQFGGTSGVNQLSVGGLSFGTDVERWIFTAGPRGMAIWRDGIKVGSQATAVTRTQSVHEAVLNLNRGSGSNGDVQEWNYFHIVADQWSDDLCRWWSAEPYDHLYAAPFTYPGPGQGKGTKAATIAAAGNASGTTVPKRLSMLGVG